MKSNWLVNKTTMLAAAWITAMSITGFGAGTESFMGWFMISVLALGPATVLLHFAHPTLQTVSQEIHEARR